MRTACFTIVKNEKYFLPILEEYYTKEFDDFYVLNHNSTDGSIEKLKPTTKVINVNNDVVFDHEWLLSTIVDFTKKLLNTYDVVCFVEADEFLIHRDKSLRQVCQELFDSESDCIMLHGYSLKDNNETFDRNDTILSQKKKFKRDYHYDKVLITKVSIPWSHGFHTVRNLENDFKCEFHENLYLIHLHHFDRGVFLERVRDRLALKENFSQDGKAIHNQMTDYEYYLQQMDEVSSDEGIDLNLPNLF